MHTVCAPAISLSCALVVVLALHLSHAGALCVAQLSCCAHPELPAQVLAQLGRGGWFGGGPDIYGSGALQSSLYLLVEEQAELLHMSLDDLMQHGGLQIIR